MLIDDVGSALNNINVQPDAIQAILDMLEYCATDVHGSIVHPVPEARFGSSPAASALAYDAEAAHRKVGEAMRDMVAGLNGYRENIVTYVNDVSRTDDDNAATMSGLTSSTACVATPKIATSSECGMPVAPVVPELQR